MNDIRQENNIKAIVFDFDGTLADTMSVVWDIAIKLNDKLKLFKKEEISLEDFRNTSSSDFLGRLTTPKYKLLYYLWMGRRLFGENIKNIKAFDGIEETLKMLKSLQIKLAVVSSNSKTNVKKFLAFNKLEYFDIVESPLLVFNKTRLIKKVVGQLGVDPSEVFYVGVFRVDDCLVSGYTPHQTFMVFIYCYY
ncbi:MAG: HAD hydrolase-like protein [Chlorobiales bacterium]|nr:HAD hydrolase-like protein [Chlorobiales bacterium]